MALFSVGSNKQIRAHPMVLLGLAGTSRPHWSVSAHCERLHCDEPGINSDTTVMSIRIRVTTPIHGLDNLSNRANQVCLVAFPT